MEGFPLQEGYALPERLIICQLSLGKNETVWNVRSYGILTSCFLVVIFHQPRPDFPHGNILGWQDLLSCVSLERWSRERWEPKFAEPLTTTHNCESNLGNYSCEKISMQSSVPNSFGCEYFPCFSRQKKAGLVTHNSGCISSQNSRRGGGLKIYPVLGGKMLAPCPPPPPPTPLLLLRGVKTTHFALGCFAHRNPVIPERSPFHLPFGTRAWVAPVRVPLLAEGVPEIVVPEGRLHVVQTVHHGEMVDLGTADWGWGTKMTRDKKNEKNNNKKLWKNKK